jgi:hypothetical protein
MPVRRQTLDSVSHRSVQNYFYYTLYCRMMSSILITVIDRWYHIMNTIIIDVQKSANARRTKNIIEVRLA